MLNIIFIFLNLFRFVLWPNVFNGGKCFICAWEECVVIQFLSYVWLLAAHELQHAWWLCITLSARDWSNSCPLHQCFYLTISFSAPSHPTTFSSCLQSFPSSGSFSMSWLFTSGSQRIGASASAPVLSMNIHGWVSLELTVWFPLGLNGLVSFLSKGLSRIFSNTTSKKLQFFSTQPSLWSRSHIHTWLLEKP